MNGIELNERFNYDEMEKALRQILLEEKLATLEELATLTCLEACNKFLEYYEVISCKYDDTAIIKKSDMVTYISIVKHLSGED